MWFLKLILYIYIAAVLLSLLLFVLMVCKATSMFKAKHPGFSGQKMHWTDIAFSYIQIAMAVFCPLLNVALAFVILKSYDSLCNDTVRRMEERYHLVS